MPVLIAVASRHGSTREIAEAIAQEMRAADQTVEVRDAADHPPVEQYEAVIIGSAVYMGHWLEPARDLVARHAATLSARPVWLFSSGPIGDPPRPKEEPVDVAGLLEVTRARQHRVFAGKLDRHTLGFAEKAVVLALRAPEGDFRDWAAIRNWAREIASALPAPAVPGA